MALAGKGTTCRMANAPSFHLRRLKRELSGDGQNSDEEDETHLGHKRIRSSSVALQQEVWEAMVVSVWREDSASGSQGGDDSSKDAEDLDAGCKGGDGSASEQSSEKKLG